MELAKQGYEVVFCNGNTLATNVATKETLYFSTTDQQAATEWLDLRVKEGYTVAVTFDEETKTFNCVAWR